MQDMAQFSMMRSFRRDASVQEKKLAPGTVRRIGRFAAPYQRDLAVFLGLIVVAAFVTVLNPLIFKKIIDDGIGTNPPATGDRGLVLGLALLVAGLALLDAVLQLWSRWCSTRIGEGLIYDMRSQVYTHISRMPIAFFTRTQTGALISRLNNDVLGAQSAFTGTLSGVVSNVIGVVLTLVAMFLLSWQITLLSLVLLPVFVIPAKLIGTKLQELTRESYALNAQMTNSMTERFNVSGALLVKLFGRPEVEESSFRDKAGRVRDIGVTSAMYGRVFFVSLTTVAALATAMVYGVGGTLAASGSLGVGTVVALAAYLTRLYGPLTALSNVRVDVMTALVSFERVFEVLDLEPMVAEKPDAVEVPQGALALELDDVVFSYPTAEQVSLASLESVAKLDQTPSTVGPAGRVVPCRARRAGRPRRALGRRQDDHQPARDAHVRRRLGGRPGRRARRPGRDDAVAARRGRRRDAGRAHVPRHDPRQPALRGPGRDRRRALGGAGRRAGRGPRPDAAGRARHAGRRPRLPAVRRREAADGDRPPAAEGPRRRRPGRGDRAPRLRVRGRRAAGAADGAGRAHVAGHRAPAVDGPRGRPDPRRRERPGRRARPPRGAAAPRAGSTPSCTAPSSSARRTSRSR